MEDDAMVEDSVFPNAIPSALGARNACVNEEAREFERRLHECHRVVFQVAYGVLRNRADAEEIAQDAFLRAFQRSSSLRDGEKFRCWVARASFRLALNRRRDVSRAMHRDRAWFDERPQAGDAEADALQRDFETRLRQSIERLPTKLRDVLLLSGVEELDTREIAAILEVPEGTVRSRKHLARKQLLKEFNDEDLQ